MKKVSTIIFILAIQIVFAETRFSIFPKNNSLLNPETQGGVLEFSSKAVERFELSLQNYDSLVLRNYSGLPLKALQFKILVGKSGGKLKFKSISRGAGIPESSFLLDYEVHEGELQSDGSSADVVSVVLLGWGENVLMPGELFHIISINYDVVNLESDSVSTSLGLFDVVGATATPVQDANITIGEDETIYLRKSNPVEDEKILMMQNYPNPFNPSTTIQFVIPKESFTKVEIFNSIGEKVSTLVAETLDAGVHEYKWIAEGLPSGIYFSKLEIGGFISAKKMLMIK